MAKKSEAEKPAKFNLDAPQVIPKELHDAAVDIKAAIEKHGFLKVHMATIALMKSEHSHALFPDLNARPSYFLNDALEAMDEVRAYSTPYSAEEQEAGW